MYIVRVQLEEKYYYFKKTWELVNRKVVVSETLIAYWTHNTCWFWNLILCSLTLGIIQIYGNIKGMLEKKLHCNFV